MKNIHGGFYYDDNIFLKLHIYIVYQIRIGVRLMDQALKSALDKYNGKLGQNTSEKPSIINKMFLATAIFIAVVLVFSVFVRYELLGAEYVWSEIKDVSVGDETIGSILNHLGEGLSVVISQNNESVRA